MRKSFPLLFAAVILLIAACKQKTETPAEPAADTTAQTQVVKDTFGTLPDGKVVYRFTLKNDNGVEMQVINYGGIITSLKTPDKNGTVEDIVLGYDSLSGYLKSSPYFGALIGRYGNRIAKGKFKIDGTEYTIAGNNNGQHLHGGLKGFD